MKKPENPYPEKLFPEPSIEQYALFNKKLKEAGLTPDAYNGSMGRKTWKNCCDAWEKRLPTRNEIIEILREFIPYSANSYIEDLAKTISKRIGGHNGDK